ncbi:MAG: hypothetical protein H7Z40_01530 [Phycisphaerae bacterium]|nr:hypothetical protein [Gemmatimonadaceae bacterium]
MAAAAAFYLAREPNNDRRIVDTVTAGNFESEAAHGYAGHDDSAGVVNDTSFRQARGWMRYALTTFDDTEVTVALTFIGASAPLNYDVVVEDSLIASRSFDVPSGTSKVVEVIVPFSLTKGRTNIAVTIRGRGGPTPALRELRTIQDHYELLRAGPAIDLPFAVSPSQIPFGVAR